MFQNITLLLASLIALAVGPVVYQYVRDRKRALALFDIAVFLSTFVLVVFFVFPDAVHDSSWRAFYPFMIGLLFPTFVEYCSHSLAEKTHQFLLYLIAVGLCVHTVFDGIAFSLRAHAQELPLAVILHRLPVGLVVSRLFGHTKRMPFFVIAAMSLTTVLGYVVGLYVTQYAEGVEIAYMEAFIAGFLLHVIVHKNAHVHH